MLSAVPQEWKEGDLFQEFNLQSAGLALPLYQLIARHEEKLETLTGQDLIAFCKEHIEPELSDDLSGLLANVKYATTDVALIRGAMFNGFSEPMVYGTSLYANRKERATPYAVLTMTVLNALIGAEPLRNDQNEIRVDKIFPEIKDGEIQIRSAARLDYSNDAMTSVLVPQFGAVACVQGDPVATLDIHHVDFLKSELDAGTIESLERPDFWFAEGSHMKRAVESAGHMHDQPDHPSMQLVHKDNGYAVLHAKTVRYSQDTAGTNTASHNALIQWERAIVETQPLSLHLQPGDIVLRNNRTTIFGRSPCQNWGTGENVSLLVRQRASIPAPGQ